MKFAKKLGTLTAVACAILASQVASAGEDTFINPDWANSAWYIGAGIGQTRAKIDQDRLTSSLTANGATMTAFSKDERGTGGKLYVGKQLNQYFAIEGGLFDLGKFGFNAATSGNGVLNGDVGFRGVNLDLVGQLPLSQRFSVFALVGMNYAQAKAHFTGNRLFATTNPNPTERKLNAKAGLGLEYKFSEALALRAEVERYRVSDAVGNRGDVDMASLNLVY
jgi:OOP family OmpA-OmpF porin